MKFSSITRNCSRLILGIAAVMMLALQSFATPTVTLSPSLASPQLLGTPITWTATASDSDQGTLTYAYNYGVQGGSQPLVHDYGYGNTFPALPALQEGTYQVKVTVRNDTTGKTGTASQTFVFTPRASSSNPVVVSPTANALVALFSAASCSSPDSMVVAFKNAGGIQQLTPAVKCNSKTMNFYVAGMYPSTTYSMTGILVANGQQVGQTATKQFTTGPIPSTVAIPTITVNSPPPAAAASEPILIHCFFFSQYLPVGTDLNGKVLWYYSSTDALGGIISRPKPGGYFWLMAAANSDPYLQFIREIDVAGNTVVETNVGRINEQLVAAGQMPLTDIDHELRDLPNGDILAIGSSDSILGPNVQGGADVIFDQLIVLNTGLQLQWSWNATTCPNCATQLPTSRKAILDETCTIGQGGCPPLTPPNTIANDWLHGNAAYLDKDGSIIMSLRHQDWVLKIDFNNGTGTGNILWRLGLDGDFTIIPDANDPYPWFSHQHDVEFEFNSPYLSLFDNGNTRIKQFPTQNSRCQVLLIDESAMTAKVNQNIDQGVQSLALGTAQVTVSTTGSPTGLHCEAGFAGANSQSSTFYPSGTAQMTSSSNAYRSFQMHDMYSPYNALPLVN